MGVAVHMALESATHVPSQLCQVFCEKQGSQVPFCYLVATQAQVSCACGYHNVHVQGRPWLGLCHKHLYQRALPTQEE